MKVNIPSNKSITLNRRSCLEIVYFYKILSLGKLLKTLFISKIWKPFLRSEKGSKSSWEDSCLNHYKFSLWIDTDSKEWAAFDNETETAKTFLREILFTGQWHLRYLCTWPETQIKAFWRCYLYGKNHYKQFVSTLCETISYCCN